MYFKDSTFFVQSMKSWVLGQESTSDSIQLERVNFTPIGIEVYSPNKRFGVAGQKFNKKFLEL
ncbi:MAG: hypothetical protein HWD62_13140 [Cyclobacteriaceae bacterium]|nr:MAG: hypothetical protein HWD62_13140 [Cyclobacteriaceae bacterium]